MYREASGTSGMSAAMNGAVNLSLSDGWVPEFASDNENCFLIPMAEDQHQPVEDIDQKENANLMDVLSSAVIPAYYNNQAKWLNMIKQAAADVVPAFESARLAKEYYEVMYKS